MSYIISFIRVRSKLTQKFMSLVLTLAHLCLRFINAVNAGAIFLI